MSSIADRRNKIIEIVSRKGFVKVKDLSKELDVTPVTIRKDLSFLEDQNYIYRAHGSAMPARTPVRDISIKNKKVINSHLKENIGKAAAKLVKENDSIIIASGSTMTIFAENLNPQEHINVVSPSVNISMILGEYDNVTIMQLGGILYGNSLSVRGEDAARSLNNIVCDKVFFGVDGFDIEYGFTCATIEEAELTQHMIKTSAKTIVLADSTKLGRRGFGRICPVEDIDILITDDGLPLEIKESFEDLGIQVILASSQVPDELH